MDYLRYWSFREPPFAPAAARFFFMAAPQRHSLAWIQDHVVSGNQIGLISAPSGCGITTLFKQVAQSNGFNDCATEVVVTSGRHPSVDRVHADLAKSMNLAAKRDALGAVAAAVDILWRRSIRPVWLIDDLGKHSAVAAMQVTQRCRPMTVIASVTPRLHTAAARSLGKRICETELASFSRCETAEFIQHSMQAAGCRKEPFLEEAIHALYQLSHGCIRMLCHIAEKALVSGVKDGAMKISATAIQTAANDARRVA